MKNLSIVLCTVFGIWVIGLLLAIVVIPDQSFSEMENRSLSAFPKFTMERLFSGRFGEEFENYLNDQFPFRDFFMQTSTSMQYALVKREIGGVYFIEDGLAPSNQLEYESRVDQNIACLIALREGDVPLYVSLIPDAACIWDDRLPYGAPEMDQKELIDKVYTALGGEGCVDVYSALKAADQEEIFYHTDHHWTSLGAYYGYSAILRAIGAEPVPLETYTSTLMSDSFYGTLYSKAPAFWLHPDKIIAYASDLGTNITVFDGIKSWQRSLYNPEKLQTKDKYAVFLGGNQPLAVLETKAKEQPRLLVLRDSYFDALTPYLQPHFSQIHLVDVRYYQQDIQQYIQENEIDFVFAAYSVNQFANIMNLSAVVWESVDNGSI